MQERQRKRKRKRHQPECACHLTGVNFTNLRLDKLAKVVIPPRSLQIEAVAEDTVVGLRYVFDNELQHGTRADASGQLASSVVYGVGGAGLGVEGKRAQA